LGWRLALSVAVMLVGSEERAAIVASLMSCFVLESSSIMSDSNAGQIVKLGLPLSDMIPAASHPELIISKLDPRLVFTDAEAQLIYLSSLNVTSACRPLLP
jgi:hypothetical protein